MKEDARSFLDVLPEWTQLTPDKVLDSVEKSLEKGELWAMPGIARPAAAYYKLLPKVFWKSSLKLDADARAARS
jgi:hypothetical protein